MTSIVLVTGTSSGIGHSLAEVLVERGYRVYGSSRRGASNAPKGVEQLAMDVRDDASVKRAVDHILEREGHVDVLVNNAGVVQMGAVEELSIDQVKANLETNFFGAMRVTQAVLPSMRARRSGQILNVGSVAGRVASPFLASYCATKFALEGLTQSLRLELHRFGIRVSLLGPSFVKSGIPDRESRAEKKFDAYDGMREGAYARFQSYLTSGEETRAIAEEMAKVVGVKRPKARYAIGRGARQLQFSMSVTPSSILERMTRQYWGLEGAVDPEEYGASPYEDDRV